ncbi:cytochrome b5-like heme/steroid binding domain-containing protein [Suillus subaureus]|uniref:Cytochrome b5-like heme/steroid binding domain-containing protein n=1 Tax=Suillus subaureus TaxID=48587 RepID=A0A9P7JDA1_9AGAM|nr:cytochrome b5-like heme/steroid binding domain-containing protein [Suillus subaureus]KAG1815708.1 cytochrome b5-like heme/steroid binding domain-containing protein [Suillus subaureus]
MAKVVTYEELKAHSTKDSLYVLIHGEVYDVTKFIDEHPGGDDVILAEAGKDATQAFEDVGHSDEARDLLPPLLVGAFEKDGALKISDTKTPGSGASVSDAVEQGSSLMYFIPLTLLGAYFAWRFYGA